MPSCVVNYCFNPGSQNLTPSHILCFSDTTARSLPPRSRTATTTSHLTARRLLQPPQPSMRRSTASSLPNTARCTTRLHRGGRVCRWRRRLCTNSPAAGLRTPCCYRKARPCRASPTRTPRTSTSSTRPRESLRSRLSSGRYLSATTSRPRLAATAPIRCPGRRGVRRPRGQTRCRPLGRPNPRRGRRLTARPRTLTSSRGRCRRRTRTTVCLRGQGEAKLYGATPLALWIPHVCAKVTG